MMSSTFTTFDMMLTPSANPMSYVYGIMPTLLFMQLFWVTPPSRHFMLANIFMMMMSLTTSTKNNYLKMALFTLTPMFNTIAMMNLWGAAPYTVTMTSHLMLTLSMGLPMWTTLMILSLSFKLKQSMSHFLPENSPTFIASFLALVETLSSYIRPLTLSFRLSANISAGHVILGMIMSASVFSTLSSSMSTLVPLITGIGYTMFELAICLIQAFVFTLLLNMYSNDHIPTKTMSCQ